MAMEIESLGPEEDCSVVTAMNFRPGIRQVKLRKG